MQFFVLYIFIAIIPSLTIYYFTYGNWPLAFKIQIGYFVLLIVIAIVFFLKSINNIGSGGRGSNQIGAAGAIFGFFISLIPFVLSVGGIAFFYKGIPSGEPGVLNSIIKWGFIIITVTSLIFMRYIYIRPISYLPKFIKQPLYIKLIDKDFDVYSSYHLELRRIVKRDMIKSDKVSDLLILSRNRDLLDIMIFYEKTLPEDEKKNVMNNKMLIIQSICSQKKETAYPNDEDIKDILSRLSYKKAPRLILMEFIKCIESGDEFNISNLNDDEFRGLILEKYPYRYPF